MSRTPIPQRNVTLAEQTETAEELAGKPFPCPLCGAPLPLEMTRKEKPYCTCNSCGIQIFFRGKAGIRRLQKLLTVQEPILEEFRDSSVAVALYNRLAQLKEQREMLVQKQGIIFRDKDLDSAIAAVDREIKQTQSQLEKAGKTL
jgi:DNA-directed RNA polymerase subunit RPC12/RpoP